MTPCLTFYFIELFCRSIHKINQRTCHVSSSFWLNVYKGHKSIGFLNSCQGNLHIQHQPSVWSPQKLSSHAFYCWWSWSEKPTFPQPLQCHENANAMPRKDWGSYWSKQDPTADSRAKSQRSHQLVCQSTRLQSEYAVRTPAKHGTQHQYGCELNSG